MSCALSDIDPRRGPGLHVDLGRADRLCPSSRSYIASAHYDYSAGGALRRENWVCRLRFRHRMKGSNRTESGEPALFRRSNVTTLLNEQATARNIRSAIDALSQRTTENDLVEFYFSGRVVPVGKQPNLSKAIFPTDGDFQKGGYLRISDVVESLSTMRAKNILVVIDG